MFLEFYENRTIAALFEDAWFMTFGNYLSAVRCKTIALDRNTKVY